MPRFSDAERAILRTRLLQEGEALFAAHGLLKVTVAELAEAAGMAKGSFYVFFGSKEELYMEILTDFQRGLWSEMERFLQERRDLPPFGRVLGAMLLLLERCYQKPMLVGTDKQTLDQLYRKLPPERLEEHTSEDMDALSILERAGFVLRCERRAAAMALQLVVVAALGIQEKDETLRQATLQILLEGVLWRILEVEAG